MSKIELNVTGITVDAMGKTVAAKGTYKAVQTFKDTDTMQVLGIRRIN